MADIQPGTVTLSRGQVLIRQGDSGGHAWLVQDGQLEVFRTRSEGVGRVAILKPHSVVGEMALMKIGKPTASAVVGESGATIEIIRGGDFKQAMASMPKIP